MTQLNIIYIYIYINYKGLKIRIKRYNITEDAGAKTINFNENLLVTLVK